LIYFKIGKMQISTFIIHVSSNTQREKHIIQQIKKSKLLYNYQFINEGDIKAINNNIHQQYFGGALDTINAATSCAYKHILAYEAVVSQNLDFALILEDDIFLQSNFDEIISAAIYELQNLQLNNYFISLEDSNLKYVAGKELIDGKFLYKKDKGRLAGAYLVDNQTCQNMLEEIAKNKCNLTIDWFHNYCAQLNLLQIYWLHPTVAYQGSLTGSIPSLIDDKKTGFFREIAYFAQKLYKKLLYKFR
jgi:GR25 family glycosyltransferase involved in LPS biosynthesis